MGKKNSILLGIFSVSLFCWSLPTKMMASAKGATIALNILIFHPSNPSFQQAKLTSPENKTTVEYPTYLWYFNSKKSKKQLKVIYNKYLLGPINLQKMLIEKSQDDKNKPLLPEKIERR